MRLRHQRGKPVAMRRDRVVGHVEGMAGRVAKPLPRCRGHGLDAPAAAPATRAGRPVRRRDRLLTFWPISVTSRTPASASRSTSAARFSAARDVSVPRVDGTTQKVQNLSQPSCTVTKGCDAAPAHRGAAWRHGEMIELVVGRKLGLDRVALALLRERSVRAGDEVVLPDPDHEVDRRRPVHGSSPSACDATGSRDEHAPVVGHGRFLQPAHAA